MATFNVVLVLCTLTTSMILESKSDPVPLLDTMKVPLVVDVDMTRVKSHINGIMENEISNLTQGIQRMVDDGVQKKIAEMETRMNTLDTKLKSELNKPTCQSGETVLLITWWLYHEYKGEFIKFDPLFIAKPPIVICSTSERDIFVNAYNVTRKGWDLNLQGLPNGTEPYFLKITVSWIACE